MMRRNIIRILDSISQLFLKFPIYSIKLNSIIWLLIATSNLFLELRRLQILNLKQILNF